jgi:hypothetical protein
MFYPILLNGQRIRMDADFLGQDLSKSSQPSFIIKKTFFRESFF